MLGRDDLTVSKLICPEQSFETHKAKLAESKRETGTFTAAVGDFKPFLRNREKTRHRPGWDAQHLRALSQAGGTLRPTTAEHTLPSSARGVLPGTRHVLRQTKPQ